ncbi:hypothetical protein KOI35_21445 [Actinoplanes bogorensis]|uniref:Uncharacterized protein n=1 Tax=Paractinoplanes bogorensis TaxID=1610840 RepID=A0ABS5YRU9_9ACTN|nr:hypothetical protein [Actinoplanes bogorensis]MBU2666083.1 hypothetical protein [Actinoplanes bogorensis]
MPLLIDLLKDILLGDEGLLTGAASLVYATTITGAASAALFSRSPERRRTARDLLALLLRTKPGDGGESEGRR